MFSRQANVVKMIEFHRAKALDDVDNATMPSKKDRIHKHHKHHNGHRKKKHQVHDFNGTQSPSKSADESNDKKPELILDPSVVNPSLTPPSMTVDDSIKKSSNKVCRPMTIENQDANRAPLPMGMQFDDSLAKEKARSSGHTATGMTFDDSFAKSSNQGCHPVTIGNANHAPLPFDMQFDESLKEKTKRDHVSASHIGIKYSHGSVNLHDAERPSPINPDHSEHRTLDDRDQDQGNQDRVSNDELDSLDSTTSGINQSRVNGNSEHQGSTAEGNNSSIEGEFLADAVLVEEPEIYDAECVTGEQSQSSMKQHITINMPPTSSSNGQETHVKDSSRFWQSRWFLILLIVVVLCAIAGSVAGVMVYLGGKPEDDSSITTSINTPITVDVSSIQNNINGGPVLSSFHVIMLTSEASNGTCLVDENFDSITYVPDKGFTGTDHCDYMICDLVDCIEDTLEVDVMQDVSVCTK